MKLLHERLRELSKSTRPIARLMDDFNVSTGCDLDAALADEIEKYYLPRPRFEDGEPVQFGDEAKYLQVIDEISFFMDGMVTVGHDGNTFMVEDFVARPEPKVLDADGVEYMEGQRVWSLAGVPYVVDKVIDKDHIRVRFPDEETAHAQFTARTLTHKEPDSIEKQLDRLNDWCEKHVFSNAEGDEFIRSIRDHISAIMERDI